MWLYTARQQAGAREERTAVEKCPVARITKGLSVTVMPGTWF